MFSQYPTYQTQGRNYNDLSQYPVFPWILSDYTSETLNLNDPSVYRDLSKPIGALNEARLEKLRERYRIVCELDDPTQPPFLYGSHYSSPGIVLYFLLRLEPFTSHFLKLQGGKFDLAMRSFWSIPAVWENCLNNASDVKELIPEFFYLPCFLENVNGLNLGRLDRTGPEIPNVILPPWARGSATNFIEIHRRALGVASKRTLLTI